MSPWAGTAVYLVGAALFIAIRVPHDKRSKQIKVAESRRGVLEQLLLALMSLGFIVIPLLYAFTSALAFADHRMTPGALAAGSALLLASLWLFFRSHADLGANWSVSLQIRENHELVRRGVYRSIRHPMYAAIYLFAAAQACLLANWIAGFSLLAAFTLMFAARLGREERMMAERFGPLYAEYKRSTKRLIPRVW